MVVQEFGGELGSFHMVVAATGFRPDLQMLREVRLDLEPAIEAPRALAPLIDPRVHSCGTVPPHGAAELGQPETNFYLAGMKSYGKGADVSEAHRLRTGALDRRGARKRSRGRVTRRVVASSGERPRTCRVR
jgi:hypothetical protein